VDYCCGATAAHHHLARENVAAAVRGPKRIVKTGTKPMLEAVEWRKVE
jgi:hypothetical protein